MSIAPIGQVASLPLSVNGPAQAAKPEATGFGDLLAKGIEGLQTAQSDADSLATQAATGDLTDVHDYMIASTTASLATELTVAVRNKAVEAFNEIMRMQI
ncbi:MAG: flagellar hook-basal body complex protein FliE [Acidimicrobiales bacterium]